jgi:hypothetical protein
VESRRAEMQCFQQPPSLYFETTLPSIHLLPSIPPSLPSVEKGNMIRKVFITPPTAISPARRLAGNHGHVTALHSLSYLPALPVDAGLMSEWRAGGVCVQSRWVFCFSKWGREGGGVTVVVDILGGGFWIQTLAVALDPPPQPPNRKKTI